MKKHTDLDAKLQTLFHSMSSILHRLRRSSTAVFNTRELLPFWYLWNRIMGKLSEYNRTNDEQSGVSSKIPEFWNGRHVVKSYGYQI